MTFEEAKALKPGMTFTYDDGRSGHRGVKAKVLSVADGYLVAQFEDRADTTKVEFVVEDWLRLLAAS